MFTLARRFRPSKLGSFISGSLLLAGCAGHAPGGEVEEEIASVAEPLLGPVFYSECSAAHRQFLAQSHLYGRVAVASDAFETCVEAAITGTGASKFDYDATGRLGAVTLGPYGACTGDPLENGTAQQQLDGALALVESENPVLMACGGTGTGNASTSGSDIYGYNHGQTEEFTWQGWLDSVVPQASNNDVCESSERGTGCRWSPHPWPYSQAAGTIWHEVLHSHGYGHGDNSDNAAAQSACGQSAPWHFQRDTIPYIVGDCISEVLNRSGFICGDIDRCGNGELRLVSDFNELTCECVRATDGSASWPLRFDVRGWGAEESPQIQVEASSLCDPSGVPGPVFLPPCPRVAGDTDGQIVSMSSVSEGTSLGVSVSQPGRICTYPSPVLVPPGGFRTPMSASCYAPAEVTVAATSMF